MRLLSWMCAVLFGASLALAATSSAYALDPPYYKRLGCFKDSAVPDLDGPVERTADNTPERCATLCKQKGFRYGAVQNGERCLCGNSYGKYGPADSCNVTCSGGTMTCGGVSASDVLERAH